MKIASLVIALLMSLSLVACGGSSAQIPEETVNDPKPKMESSTKPEESNILDDNIYKNLTNTFITPISDLITIDVKDADVGIWYTTWNDETDYDTFDMKYTLFADDISGIGIVSNEDYSKNEVLVVDIYDPDEDAFNELLNSLDWHPAEFNPDPENADPNGYIVTEDSIILVNSTLYYEEFENCPNYSKIYELYNINALAKAMGVNIQDAVTKVSSMEDACDIQYYLENALYYGIRGYDNYVNINPFGIVISDYDDIVTAIDNPYDSILQEVSTLIDEMNSGITLDGDYGNESYPSSGSSSHHTYFYNQLPAEVQQCIDNGNRVYMIEHGLAKGYYTARNDGQGKMFTLICSSNPNTSTQPELILYSDVGNHIGSGYSVTDVTDW